MKSGQVFPAVAATNLVAASRSEGSKSEPVQSRCDRLNTEFNNLGVEDGKKLTQRTVYQSAKDGLAAGTSPKKMGPEPAIPVKFLKVVATHAKVCQVGDGEEWFDDVKKVLIRTGLVDDEIVLDGDGKVVSKVRFIKDSQRRIINIDETHHNMAITGDRGGSCAVSYHNPAFQRGAVRGVKPGQHLTGVYATNAEKRSFFFSYLHSISLIPLQNR
ncbi:hypothetical protein MHU86_11832 [Fragilaria crotonensis]|nr:hypothetical protein MHU86_11832 [Fragilaria crotonensis]